MHAHELEQALMPQDGETLVFDTNPVEEMVDMAKKALKEVK